MYLIILLTKCQHFAKHGRGYYTNVTLWLVNNYRTSNNVTWTSPYK